MKHIFKIGTLTYLLLSLCLPGLFACNDASSAGTSACAGGMHNNFDSGETNLLDGPVDLPVSIAKNIDGVDASTMVFQMAGGVNLTRALRAQAGSVIGTIYFQLND